MLDQRLRRWTNIKRTLGQCLVFVVIALENLVLVLVCNIPFVVQV